MRSNHRATYTVNDTYAIAPGSRSANIAFLTRILGVAQTSIFSVFKERTRQDGPTIGGTIKARRRHYLRPYVISIPRDSRVGRGEGGAATTPTASATAVRSQ